MSAGMLRIGEQVRVLETGQAGVVVNSLRHSDLYEVRLDSNGLILVYSADDLTVLSNHKAGA